MTRPTIKHWTQCYTCGEVIDLLLPHVPQYLRWSVSKFTADVAASSYGNEWYKAPLEIVYPNLPQHVRGYLCLAERRGFEKAMRRT